MKTDNDDTLASDLLWGCQAIAREINRPERDTFHLLQQGLIPADKCGAIWFSRRSRLRAFFSCEGRTIERASTPSKKRSKAAA